MNEKVCNVLVLCTHNSARSVLAEAMLNEWATKLGKNVRGFSGGSTPSGRIHPLTLEVLGKAGIDVSDFRSKSWDEFSADGAPELSIVVTVCDDAAAEPCPVFFGGSGGQPVRVHWGYPDPSRTEGDEASRRQAFEVTRQAIGFRMLQLLALPLTDLDRARLQEALIEIGRS